MAKVRRRIFLIDKPFQFRVALYVCSWLVALTFIYPTIIYSIFDLFVRLGSLDPNGPELAALYQARDEMIGLIVTASIGFVLLTFVVGILFAHRIAGPLYKLRLFLEKLKEGDLSSRLFFRKEDHFQYLADDYNSAVGALRGRLENSARHIHAALPHCPPQAQAELQRALALLPPVK